MRPSAPSFARLGAGALWPLVLLFAACGPSFRSVRQTAALGERVLARSAVLLGGPRICELLLGATARAAQPAANNANEEPGAAPGCADVGAAETAQVMLRGAGLLSAY